MGFSPESYTFMTMGRLHIIKLRVLAQPPNGHFKKYINMLIYFYNKQRSEK